MGKRLEELWEGAPVSECKEKCASNWQLNIQARKKCSGNQNNGESPFEVLPRESERYFNEFSNIIRISCTILTPPKNRLCWQSNNLKKLQQWYKPVLDIQAKFLFSYDSNEKAKLNSQVRWIPCSWTEPNPTTRQDKTKWEYELNSGICYLCLKYKEYPLYNQGKGEGQSKITGYYDGE